MFILSKWEGHGYVFFKCDFYTHVLNSLLSQRCRKKQILWKIIHCFLLKIIINEKPRNFVFDTCIQYNLYDPIILFSDIEASQALFVFFILYQSKISISIIWNRLFNLLLERGALALNGDMNLLYAIIPNLDSWDSSFVDSCASCLDVVWWNLVQGPGTFTYLLMSLRYCPSVLSQCAISIFYPPPSKF